jgi:hypothetical protein
VKRVHRCADINTVATKSPGTGFEDEKEGILVGRDDSPGFTVEERV